MTPQNPRRSHNEPAPTGAAGVAGPAVDRLGQPVLDPTKNVLDLVDAAVQRLDDLRAQDAQTAHQSKQTEHAHIRELMNLHNQYQRELRLAETARIDAIRTVDVNAATRATEVAATQATTLAAQVAASAEALRAQVQAAAVDATKSLANALQPIQADIAELKRAQYELAGSKQQVTETRVVRGETRLNIGAVLGGISVLLVLVFGVIGIVLAAP